MTVSSWIALKRRPGGFLRRAFVWIAFSASSELGRNFARSPKGVAVGADDVGGGDDAQAPAEPKPKPRAGYQRESVAEAAMKSVAHTVASSLGRDLVRGILGSLRR